MVQGLLATKLRFSELAFFGSKHYLSNSDAEGLSCQLLLLFSIKRPCIVICLQSECVASCVTNKSDFYYCKDKKIVIISEYLPHFFFLHN